jgi:undecaprenyl-diphosphatase
VDIHSGDATFLSFLMATHLATALVLLGSFSTDWVRIVRALWRTVKRRRIARDDADERLAWLLVVGTIPAGLLGLVLEHKLRDVFGSPTAVSIFLALNGVMLLGAERLRRRAPVVERTRSSAEADSPLARRLSFRGAAGSGSRRLWGCCRASRGRARRLAAACCRACPTRTRHALPSCWQRRSSAPPGCSSCPTSLARKAFGIYCLYAGLVATVVFVAGG